MPDRKRSTANVFIPRRKAPIDIALRKHSEALASIEVHKRWIAKLELRCRELTYEIKALGGFPKPRPNRLGFRGKGEVQRTMFALMRKRGAITAADLADALAPQYGISTADKAAMYALRQRAIQCFKRNEKKGLVRQIGWSEAKTRYRAHGRFVLWELAVKRRLG